MWPLKRSRDPSPSRLAYRLHRLWLTPAMRRLVRIGLPAAALAVPVAMHVVDADNRAALTAHLAEMRRAIEQRPEFIVQGLRIEGADPAVERALAQSVEVEFPVSSFHLDLAALRNEFMAFDVVRSAELRVTGGRELAVTVRQREPALIWRGPAGLLLVDGEGHRIARVDRRADHPELPLIVGAGAPAAAGEARELIAAAEPLRDRLRGLVRVGARRWDVMLDRDQHIMLPDTEPLRALQQAIALDRAHDMLARDVRALDLRLSGRVTVRLGDAARERLRHVRSASAGGSN